MLKERVKTGALLTVVVCLVLSLSNITWFLKFVVAALSIQCFLELYHGAGGYSNPWGIGAGVLLAVLIAAVEIPRYTWVLLAVFLGAIVFFTVLMSRLERHRKLHPAMVGCTAGMIFLFLKTIPILRSRDKGLVILAFAILASTVTDCAAYFVGRKWGKRKLAPRISPNKTREGSLGGILATTVVLLLLTLCLNLSGVVKISYPKILIYGICASFVGQFGDLSFSAIKRIAGVKDYGALLPGHGGLLDRIDGLLFVLPFTHLYWELIWRMP